MPGEQQPKANTEAELNSAVGEAGLRAMYKRQAEQDERLQNLTPTEVGKYEVQFYLDTKQKPKSREELLDWIKQQESKQRAE